MTISKILLPLPRLAFVSLAMFVVPLGADEPPPEDSGKDVSPGTGSPATPVGQQQHAVTDQVRQLIEQLDANRFSQRQAASRQLAAIGEPAIAALARAAVGGRRETSIRALDVLKSHYENGGAKLKSEAKNALEGIANAEHPTASSRAEVILNPPQQAAGRTPANAIPIPGLQQVPGRIQIQLWAAAGGRLHRVQVKNINGVRDIKVVENGKKTTIHDDPNGGITVEITQTKDGKRQTKKFTAKNADELKNKHPDAHRIYQKYAKQPRGLQIQGIQIQQRLEAVK